jgi:hypothetical protein
LAADEGGSEMRDITIFFTLADDAYVRDFLLSLANQSHAKSNIHLFCDISKLSAKGKDLFREFLAQPGGEYRNVLVNDQTLADIRQQSVRYAITSHTDYLSIDENIIIHPKTLRRLHDLNLEVVAPMLVYDGRFSNFHADVDDRGYFKGGDSYDRILSRAVTGVINVPVVNACYLIGHERLGDLAFDDRSGRPEYVILCDTLRKKGIPQYIDNRFNHGIMLNYHSKTENEIREIDLRNNKQFYLEANKENKKGVICDADWLSRYVIHEHIYLMKLLHDRYDFHILNCNKLNVGSSGFAEDLNSYGVLLTAYHRYNKVPLDRVSARKIYKIDDLENDAEYTKIVIFNIAHSDIVISPYAYVFDEFYKHDAVFWVPYSCALESYEDWQAIEFNETPKAKILQSGNVAAAYPFRQYVASLDHEGLEKLPHQGWVQDQSGQSEQTTGMRYYKKLNDYLCCFTDALKFRYIVMKNFEIAATGSLLLTDKAVEKEMNELGFVDHETCIFSERETFLEKADWILDPRNREAVDAIRRAGMRLVRERHMTKHRAAQIAMLAGNEPIDTDDNSLRRKQFSW